MSTPGPDGLWTRSDLESAIERGDLADWKATRYRTFHRTMTDDEAPYPCYFAVEAEEEGLFRYVFPGDPDDPDARTRLARALEAYLADYESIGEFSSLVVLFEPAGDQSPEAYKRQFWDLLEWLGENDPEPWPRRVPTDPDHPKWRYCFAGEPLFLVARAPFYEARRSRHTAHGLEVPIQPSGVFEELSGMSDDGQRAQHHPRPPERVRRRPPPSRLGRLLRPAPARVEAVHAPGDQRGERRPVSASRALPVTGPLRLCPRRPSPPPCPTCEPQPRPRSASV